MQALAFPVVLFFLLIAPTPGAAQGAEQAAALQEDRMAAGAQLAQAARGEAQRLRQLDGDSKGSPSQAESHDTSQRQTVKGAREKSQRREQSHARLLESERVRIRDKYRELQKQRIAARKSEQVDLANRNAARTSESD